MKLTTLPTWKCQTSKKTCIGFNAKRWCVYFVVLKQNWRELKRSSYTLCLRLKMKYFTFETKIDHRNAQNCSNDGTSKWRKKFVTLFTWQLCIRPAKQVFLRYSKVYISGLEQRNVHNMKLCVRVGNRWQNDCDVKWWILVKFEMVCRIKDEFSTCVRFYGRWGDLTN